MKINKLSLLTYKLINNKRHNHLFFTTSTTNTKEHQITHLYPRSNITQKFVNDCVNRLQKIKLYKKK
jgi:hypothetical protein